MVKLAEKCIRGSGGTVTRRYTLGHWIISETQNTSGAWTTSFYGYDGHNSVRFLTNSAGSVTDNYTFDAFGIKIAGAGSTPNQILYSGEYLDLGTGNYDLRARVYDENTGTFLTADTTPGQLPYVYTSDNPVMFADPSGKFGLPDVSISLTINEDLDSEDNLAVEQAAKNEITGKQYDVYFGIMGGTQSGGRGVASFGLLPHLFLYVDYAPLGEGMSYDINDRGLYVTAASLAATQERTIGDRALWEIARFNLAQYITWSTEAYVLAEATDAQRNLNGLLTARSLIPANFSYNFVTGVNCYKWTVVAGFSAVLTSHFGGD